MRTRSSRARQEGLPAGSPTPEVLLAETDAFRAFVEHAPTAISLKDRGLRYRLVNGQMADLLGLPTEAIIGRTARDIYPGEVADSLEEGDRRVLAERRVVRLEQELHVATAEPRTYQLLKFPVFADTNVVEGIGTIASDVTEAAHAQSALAESEERFRQLTESIDVAFILRSADPYEFLYVSPVLQKLTGVTSEELRDPRTVLRLVHPDDLQVFVDRLSQGRAEDVFDAEHRIIRPDGVTRWMRARAWPVSREGGRVTRVAATYEDITERKEAELALEAARAEATRANQAKSDFMSRMSHELRTPLNAVLGFSELLTLSDLAPEHRQSVEQIQKAGRHLLALVDDVLDISRVETGDINLSLQPVHLPGVVRDAMELVRPLATARGVVIEESVRSEGYAQADPHRLRQVLINLVSNAVKYNRPGGHVRIACGPAETGRVRIMVRDTGVGIAHEDLIRLFTPFDRLESQRVEVEGTGLGLALSKGLVEAMHGTVGAESEIGKGSTFWVELEGADPPAEHPSGDLVGDAVLAPPSAPGVGTVLYIEDNLSNLLLVEGIVAKRPGVELISAMQGVLGLELAAARRPDLVILDLHLPDMPGEDVLRRLRAEPATAHTPVIVLSADATRRQAERLLAAGATDYLTKPFEIGRLLQWIDSALRANVGSEGAVDSKTATNQVVRTSTVARASAQRRPRSARPSRDVLDPGQLASLQELDDTGEALQRLGELFVEDARVKADALADAVAEGDAETVAATAHNVKGSAGIVGATALAAAASAIEVRARTGGLPSKAALALFRREVDAAVAAVRALLTKPAAPGVGADADAAPPSSISGQ